MPDCGGGGEEGGKPNIVEESYTKNQVRYKINSNNYISIPFYMYSIKLIFKI